MASRLLQAAARSSFQSRCGTSKFAPFAGCSRAFASHIEARKENPNVARWIDAYRQRGHLYATINPLDYEKQRYSAIFSDKALALDRYGLNPDTKINVDGLVTGQEGSMTIRELEQLLQKTYCGHMGFEFSHILSEEESEWFASQVETMSTKPSDEERKRILRFLIRSEAWDLFMSSKFPTFKRYGGEGNEALISGLDKVFEVLQQHDVKDTVIGMAHRGRFNLMIDLLNYPARYILNKVMGRSEMPAEMMEMGYEADVTSHLYTSVDLPYDTSKDPLHVSFLPNPSHLEGVNPVTVGKARAKAWDRGDYAGDGNEVCPILIHGDSAFSGQGVVQETFLISKLPNFRVGGTIHIITNNQVGFTAVGRIQGRSSLYASDVGKMVETPVIHVNGDNPDAVANACRIATEYRQKFRRDIIVDLKCYRRHGHNEVDEPAFTQPKMYKAIRSHTTVPRQYAKQLVTEGVVTEGDVKSMYAEIKEQLESELASAKSDPENALKISAFEGKWAGLSHAYTSDGHVNLRHVDAAELAEIGKKSVTLPEGFTVHPRLVKAHVEARAKKIEEGQADWATAEALAFGTLMRDGYDVRIVGQDSMRGTFSQRHAVLVDQNTEEHVTPLNLNRNHGEGSLQAVSSPLSELAVLGFEYGYSLETPKTLCLWEAQFGDFANQAQVTIDNFIATGEAKWARQSGLVMLLPHGYDATGPEHSSARIERFLQLCDDSHPSKANMQVVNLTTPANYYHVLRRQIGRDYRRPLVVIAPKTLLRHPKVMSSLEELSSGQFQPVIDDSDIDPSNVSRVMFCSGKIYFELLAERQKKGDTETAIVRLEELCPFPAQEVANVLSRYNATSYVWCQEEHRNMGAYSFVERHLNEAIGSPVLSYIGRAPLAQVATGSSVKHAQEYKALMADAFPAN
eukprot:TRINITY_DN7907_c0_g1::TRINITY_DN7907_c0_g1_i1::g.23798::m.23798 TRINITY_DN7907_c0_g1::TRINITY_DN7907_c0_g1_i1::g.23798  ORF type:complete len:910 (+),score=328.56,sp/Q54VG0/DHTK1_DICDI/45.92/0.0,Transket_pyr/PF02779.19/5.6e-60,E1_dh/PF00676.15/3.1e-45,DUF4343/PF14243.1/0.23,TOMM6/PF15184.1/0.41 TRINITY_DN7907_c0_g1_i1:35-2764(+)